MITNRRRVRDSRTLSTLPSISSVHGNGTSLGTAIYSETAERRLTGTVEIIDEENHPGFSKRMLGQKNPIMGDMEKMWAVHNIPDCLVSLGPYPQWNSGGRQTLQGDIMQFIERQVGSPDFANIPSLVNSSEALALVKAYNRFQNLSILSPEYAREFTATLAMFKHPFSSATTLLKAMSKQKKKNLGRLAPTVTNTARATSDAWLERRYGWGPIFMDYDAASEEYAKFVNSVEENEAFLVARASDGIEITRNVPYDVAIQQGSYLRFNGEARFFTNLKANAGVIYRVNRSHGLDKLLKYSSLHGSQLLPVAWQLTPYSFVADWFLNTGDWLNAINPQPNIEILGSWVTTVKREVYEWPNATYRCEQLGAVNSGTLGSSSMNRVTVTRNVRPVLPLHPTVKLKSLSVLQAADGLALTVGKVYQMLKGLRH